MSKNRAKHRERPKHYKRKVIRTLCVIILIVSILYVIYYLYTINREKQNIQELKQEAKIDTPKEAEQKTERMAKLEELQKQNSEIIALVEIEGTNINYPVCQTNDNSYYLTHNYKKEQAPLGSLFLDKDFDLTKPSTNYLIYGHRSKTGLMLEDLIKYSKEEFYQEHPTIKFTTSTEDATYEIIAVFYSRVYYKSEQNVFRYYYFIDAENETEYNNYIENCKKASIYDTGKTANYGDQLLTLSTCEYSQEDGRFAVVARKK